MYEKIENLPDCVNCKIEKAYIGTVSGFICYKCMGRFIKEGVIIG